MPWVNSEAETRKPRAVVLPRDRSALLLRRGRSKRKKAVRGRRLCPILARLPGQSATLSASLLFVTENSKEDRLDYRERPPILFFPSPLLRASSSFTDSIDRESFLFLSSPIHIYIYISIQVDRQIDRKSLRKITLFPLRVRTRFLSYSLFSFHVFRGCQEIGHGMAIETRDPRERPSSSIQSAQRPECVSTSPIHQGRG